MSEIDTERQDLGPTAELTADGEVIFFDKHFRRVRKKGRIELIEAPDLGALVPDTHAHLTMMPDPSLALARAGAVGVRSVCCMTDVAEEGTQVFDQLQGWIRTGMVYAHRLAWGRC